MHCKASGDSSYVTKKQTSTGLLEARGIMIDLVASASMSAAENSAYPADVQALTNSEAVVNDTHIYGNNLAEALARTLTMDHPGSNWGNATIFDILWTGEKPLVDPEALEIVQASSTWEAFETFRHSNFDFSIFGCKIRDFFPSGIAERSAPGLTHLQVANMRLSVIALVGRRLITTKNGYLGLAPEEVEVDDVVAILFGSKFPVILRPSGQNYIYVGECYVDGIMDGEILKPESPMKYEDVDITIC
jgi:hypothetical protein